MIYTEMTRKAMQMAYKAHHGQVDHGGIPYIFHPIHLAEQMTDELSTCVALLHDILEDTSMTAEALAKEFPPEVIEKVLLLTHRPEEDYFAYVARVAADPVARQIKLADLNHNTDRTRLVGASVPEETLARWDKKYSRAREILNMYN